jgi:hypothetical protein
MSCTVRRASLELSEMPRKGIDPDWQEKLEEKEE